MKNLSFVAAALVAGLVSFVPYAHSTSAHIIQPTTSEYLKEKFPIRFNGKPAVDQTTTASILQAKPAKDAPKVKPAKTRSSFDAIIAKHAQKNGVPIALAHAVVTIESNYRPNARGSAGEIGLMQIKPATARMMGYSGSVKGLYDPETNIRFGMKYLAKAQQLGGGDTCSTILKYNAGHGAKRMNKVSAGYCAKVKRHMGPA